MELVIKVAQLRATRTRSGWITRLDYKVVNHTVENDTVIEVGIGKFNHPACRKWRTLLEKLEHLVAEALHVDANRAVSRQHHYIQ